MAEAKADGREVREVARCAWLVLLIVGVSLSACGGSPAVVYEWGLPVVTEESDAVRPMLIELTSPRLIVGDLPAADPSLIWSRSFPSLHQVALSPSGDHVAVLRFHQMGQSLSMLNGKGEELWTVPVNVATSSPVRLSLPGPEMVVLWGSAVEGVNEYTVYRAGALVAQGHLRGASQILMSPSEKYWVTEDDAGLRCYAFGSGELTMVAPAKSSFPSRFVPGEDVLVVHEGDRIRLLGPSGMEWGRYQLAEALRSDVRVGHRGEFIAVSTRPPDASLYTFFLAEDTFWTRLLPDEGSYALRLDASGAEILAYPGGEVARVLWVESRTGDVLGDMMLIGEAQDSLEDAWLLGNAAAVFRWKHSDRDRFIFIALDDPESAVQVQVTPPVLLEVAEEGEAYVLWDRAQDLIQYYRTSNKTLTP